MSHCHDCYSSVLIEHARKKRKTDIDQYAVFTACYSDRSMSSWTLESQCDVLPHKIRVPQSQMPGTLPALDRYEQIFDRYSSDHQFISADDMRRFCQDLSIEPASYEMFLFFFLCGAKQIHSLAKNDFLHGLHALVDHIVNANDLRTALVHYDISAARGEFYRWIYQLGVADGQRQLTTENAISLWRLFYSRKIERPPLLDDWLYYLENAGTADTPRMISTDTWMLFPRFAEFIHLNGYGSYDSNEAWPCLAVSKMSKSKGKTTKSTRFHIEPEITVPTGKQRPVITSLNLPSRPGSSPLSSHRDYSTGQLRLSDTHSYKFTSNDLVDYGIIGQGAFGVVSKMKHQVSGTMMAVKRIRSTVDETSQKQMLVELDIVMRDNTCAHIIQFYGALFEQGECWICMEVMNTSLDHLYKFVYHKLNQVIPESVLAYISLSTVQALDYMKSRWKIIHRDVKPSNILVSRTAIKLCDFGISGELIDSIAKTRDAGYRPYLPPERLDPTRATRDGYDVRSDVWSLGITIYEISTGYFPFRPWKSVFDQLEQIVDGPPLKLTIDRLSEDCKDFVNTCLNKDENQRPKYKALLEHPFLQKANESKQQDNALAYLSDIIDRVEKNTDVFELYYYLP